VRTDIGAHRSHLVVSGECGVRRGGKRIAYHSTDVTPARAADDEVMVSTTELRGRHVCGTHATVRTTAELVQLAAAGDPERKVWARRFFRYAFDPDREIPDSHPASATQARAAIRRALNTWMAAGVGLSFREVDLDEEPDVVFQWVPREHSAADGEHETLAEQLDTDTPDPDDTDNPIAHADFPPRLSQTERTRYVCFDQEDLVWDIVDDAGGDGQADVTSTGPGDIESVALHELGHFLGLEHLTDSDAVMFKASNGQRALQSDDLTALKKLYPPQGPTRFNAIWAGGSVARKALAWPPPADTTFPGVPATQLGQAIEEAEEDGWQPTRINAYEVPEGRFYNVVMDRATGHRPWTANKTEEEFFERHDELVSAGYQIMTIDAFRGGERWNGVWIRDDAETTLLRLVGDADAAREAIQDVDGWRPTAITAYVDVEGVQHWAVVLWRNPAAYRLRLGLTRDEMRGVTDAMVADGFYPFDIGTFVLPDGAGERWNGIYAQTPFRFANFRARGQYDAPNQVTRYEADDLDPFSLNAFVRPAPLGTAQVTAHEITHPAPAPGTSVVTMGVAVDDQRVYATRYVQHPPETANSEPDGTLVVVDRLTMAELHRTTVGHRPRQLAVDPVNGRIYVANWGQRGYSVSVVDGATLDVLATIPLGPTPGPLAVNPATNRVYVTSWNQGVVHVIDGESLQLLAPIPLGGHGPLGIDVDAERNQLYVTIVNRSFRPFRNGLVRITDHAGPSLPEIEPFVPLNPLLAQSQDVAIDPEHDRVYVGNLGGGGEPPSINVLHRASLDVLAKVNVPGSLRAVAVNPDARELYAASDRGTVVFDAATVRFVRLLDERMAWGVAAADGTARQVFLAERNGSITRLNP